MENTVVVMDKNFTQGKPLITIAMAVYNPNLDWFEEQLRSLDAQTYPNLELRILDDCSSSIPYETITALVEKCICAFPYYIARNEKNVGSNITFNQLTMEARGIYIAYCDQDDIWFPEKVERCFERMRQTGALLVCSDVQIINQSGQKIAESITQIRPRHQFLEGEGLDAVLLYRNFVIGCTTLVDTKTAKASCPFLKEMIHDHYLALVCSNRGKIAVCEAPQMYYRIHGGNQTGVLNKVYSKNDYYREYLHPFTQRMEELKKRNIPVKELNRALVWSRAREKNYRQRYAGWLPLWRLRAVNRTTTWFELIALRLPMILFRWIVINVRKGKF